MEQARNELSKGALGDALHAVMCGAGHNLRLILAALQLYCARFGLSMHAAIAALPPPLQSITDLPAAQNGIVQGGLGKTYDEQCFIARLIRIDNRKIEAHFPLCPVSQALPDR